jgi:hypothetical protein
MILWSTTIKIISQPCNRGRAKSNDRHEAEGVYNWGPPFKSVSVLKADTSGRDVWEITFHISVKCDQITGNGEADILVRQRGKGFSPLNQV